MRSALFIIFLLCYFNSFESGSALRCFACSAVVGHKNACEVNVNNRTIATSYCGVGYTTCMTLVIGNTVTRACAMSNVCSTYYNTPGFTTCSTCVYDFCNNMRTSGTSPSVAATSVILLPLLILIKA
ncbi:hypothetical protein NQ317_006612, partial [Molorchus minor]